MPRNEKPSVRRRSLTRPPTDDRDLAVDEYFNASLPKPVERPYEGHGPTHEEVLKWPSDF